MKHVKLLLSVLLLLSFTALAVEKNESSTSSKMEASKMEASKMEASKMEASKMEASKMEASKMEASKMEASKMEASKMEASKMEASKMEASKMEASKMEASKMEASKMEASKKDSAGDMEKIDVIGSHIKRTDVEGPSPVLVIDRDQIEMSGYNSLADVLRELPVASSGGGAEISLSSGSRTSTSLRGMGNSDILFLINGRRMSPYAGTSSVDISLIPLVVIEKVEILKDGASALYGSDAVGGVINIVTKKNYSGGQVSLQGSLVQRKEGNNLSGLSSFFDFPDWSPEYEANKWGWSGKGDKLSVEASYGGSENNINYLLGGQVRFNSSLYLRDRSFGKLGNPKGGSVFGSPGSWSDGSKWNPASDCPSENIKDGICRFDYSPYMQFSPQILQSSFFAQGDTTVFNDMNLSIQSIYSYIRSHSVIAPAPDSFEDLSKENKPDYRIPVEVAKKWGLDASNPVDVLYRLVDEKGTGPRETVSNIHFYQNQVNLSKLMNTTELEGHFNWSGSYYSSNSKNYANKDILFDMVKEGTFNPFLPSDKKNDVSKATYEPTESVFSNLISFEPQFSGELAEFNNHSFMFALGGLGAWQYYSQENDEITAAGKQWGGGVSNSGTGDRMYGSLYGEVSAFLFENIVELQLATRMDYYSDYGFTQQILPFTEDVPLPVSPRLAISVQPLNELKFRASWGMGFKAPTLESLHKSETKTHPFSRDYFLCDDKYFETNGNKDKLECSSNTQYEVFLRSNPDLKPEFSESLNIGMVLEPVEHLAFNIDYYNTAQTNVATYLGLRDITKYEKKFGKEELEKTGIKVNRNSDGTIKNIISVPANLSNYKVHGLDLGLNTTIALNRGWDFGVGLEHSHLLYIERQALKDADIENPVPWYGKLENWFGWLGIENTQKDRKNSMSYGGPRWRNRAIFSFTHKDMGHRFDLVVHNIPSYLQLPSHAKKDIETLEQEGKTNEDDETFYFNDYYWQLDLRAALQLNKDMRLIVGLQNVLGLDRPTAKRKKNGGGNIYGGSMYLNSNLFSLRGRSVDARLTYNF